STKGGGAPLPKATQRDLEEKMGAPFSGVRIHTNARAVELSRELEAHAFTHGSDIYFNAGKYSPDTPEGRHLLVHELVHTMQQDQGVVRRLDIHTPLSYTAPCGGLNTRSTFTLDAPAQAAGYFVEQVDHDIDIIDCPNVVGNGRQTQSARFWKAWYVNR